MKNIKLEEIVTLFPVLNEESQRRILGGTAPTPTSPPTNPNEEDPFAIPGVTPPCPPTTNPSGTGGGTTGGSPTEEPTTSDTEGDPINPYDTPDMPPSPTDTSDLELDENTDLPDATTEDAVVADTSTTNTTDTATPDDSEPTDTPTVTEKTYTRAELDRMLNAGTWPGGYVEGLGYVDKQITAFSPSNMGQGQYSTFGEYSSTIIPSYTETLLDAVTSSVTSIAGDYASFLDAAIGNVQGLLVSDLINAGYSANDLIYSDVHADYHDQTFSFRIWDAETGKLISSRSINSGTGYYEK